MMKRLLVLLLLISHVALADTLETVEFHTRRTLVDAFDEDGLWILGIGSFATVVAHQFDTQVRDSFKDHQHMSPAATKIGEFWGGGIPEIAILGAQYFDEPNKAIPGFEGLIVGNLAVQALKYTVHRERPDGSENVSMPSGHTQASFSLAASMTKSYGWKKTWPFWLMGAYTGLTRISDNKHWLSDVTAGATLGILFGRAGFRHHQLQPTVLFNEGQPAGLLLSYQLSW